VNDPMAADWVLDGIRLKEHTVRSLVPDVFEAYCRLLHPARGYEIADDGSIENEGPVSWATVAAHNGRMLHPEAQFEAIVGLAKYGKNQSVYDHGQLPVWNASPSEGELDLTEARELSSILERHTHSETWFFAHWEGYGDLDIDRTITTRFGYPWPQAGRDHLLFAGPASALFESLAPDGYRSPNLWWPEDRAWIVATDIDLDSTYIGASNACADELVSAEGLEVLRIEPTHGITRDSDRINPLPPITE